MWERTEGMWRRTLIWAIVGIPAVLLTLRVILGYRIGTGWGWQMYS